MENTHFIYFELEEIIKENLEKTEKEGDVNSAAVLCAEAS